VPGLLYAACGVSLHSLPQLPRLPLLGNLLAFRRDPIALLRRVTEHCGDLGVFHLGRRPIVLVHAPELARAILVEQADAFEKGPVVRALARPLFGDGIVSCLTEDHRERRQQLAPLFSPRQMSAALDHISGELDRARARFAPGSTVELAEEMRRLTLATAGRILFSGDLLGEAHELAAAVEAVNRLVVDRIRNPLLPRLDGRWSPPRARRAIERLDRAVHRLVDERRADPTDHQDLLAQLLRASPVPGAAPLSDRRVRDELVTLLVAGHETTATALTWTLIRLARHPELAAQVRAELAAGPPGALTVEGLAGLTTTEQFLTETLRLHPPVHTLGRQARRPVVLGGHQLPAGTLVIVSVWLLHRRPEVYPDPERFDPGRFARAREGNVPRHAYLPFGAGPRACLGASLAMLEMKACLAGLLGRLPLRLASDQEIQPEMLVTLRPRGPITARVLEAHG
jgi:cytochrome P450